MKIAVMQPYFFPYAGYFRLIAASDLFVIYDDVQHIRRGWVNRNKFTTITGELDWFTLPLKKQDRDNTLIKDIAWSEEFPLDNMHDQMKNFPVFGKSNCFWKPKVILTPFQEIVKSLREVCLRLDIDTPMIMASSLNIDPVLSGQDRILAICKKLCASEYINAPGGRKLYDLDKFRERDMRLNILPDYKENEQGTAFKSILERLVDEDCKKVKIEIMANL